MYKLLYYILENIDSVFLFKNIFFNVLLLYLCLKYGDLKKLPIKLLFWGSLVFVVNSIYGHIINLLSNSGVDYTFYKGRYYLLYISTALSTIGRQLFYFGLILLLREYFSKKVKIKNASSLTKRIILMVILSFGTFGLYNLYWTISRYDKIKGFEERKAQTHAFLLILASSISQFFIVLKFSGLKVNFTPLLHTIIAVGIPAVNLVVLFFYFKMLFILRAMLVPIKSMHFKKVYKSNFLLIVFQIFYLQYLLDKSKEEPENIP